MLRKKGKEVRTNFNFSVKMKILQSPSCKYSKIRFRQKWSLQPHEFPNSNFHFLWNHAIVEGNFMELFDESDVIRIYDYFLVVLSNPSVDSLKGLWFFQLQELDFSPFLAKINQLHTIADIWTTSCCLKSWNATFPAWVSVSIAPSECHLGAIRRSDTCKKILI